MKPQQIFLTSILAFWVTVSSHAAVVFSTLGQTYNGSTAFNTQNYLLASDFLTDGTPRTITGLTATMGNSSQLIDHKVIFSIFTDNGSGKPGTLVNTFDTMATVPLSSASVEVTATDAGISLLANTTYWLVGELETPVQLGTVSWAFNLGEGTNSGPFATVPSTNMQRAPLGGLYLDGDSGNQLFSLDGVPTVPEPSSSALLMAAGACGLWFRRRVG